jgi:hypothetical protein
MRLRSLSIFVLLAAVTLSVSGCRKKKPPVPPPQAEAPTVEAPAPAQPETAPAPSTTETTTTTTTPLPPAPAPKPRKRAAKKPSAGVPAGSNPAAAPTVATNGTNPPPPSTPPKVVVRDGSAPEPTNQISTSMPVDKENETRLNTERSLQNTEKNLNGITSSPSGDQRLMIDQIKTYINQSREANGQGDVVRASNLAQKARLLCDELLKK